ncbi:P-loop containing nucleoside triphosphate hydrolase protein [Dipodascopsis tothii]|uniref:P-loop containing nucleoside triphosphate hydrolase protein n=1 Tax=Dipodascopsis tothii TaxID=44089 RepID=UPI0034CD57A7
MADDSDAGVLSAAVTASLGARIQTLSMARQRESLPIFRHRREILYLIETTPVVVLIGHTGSGKTTQLPQYLHEAGWTTDGLAVACTQPRRMAATSVAARVANEIGCALGQDVGYSIRFEDMTSDRTRIKYMTDGMLVREILVDPLLSRYSVIMIDEAHERSLYTDILLGVLKRILRKRPDLRVVVSSATLQAEAFRDFFGGDTKIISIEGRTHPVDVQYTSVPVENYFETAVQTVFDIHTREGPGDVLVFLTGMDEINRMAEEIADRATTLRPGMDRVAVLPLYAGLPADEQARVFEPAEEGTRKVVLATNVAETSVTIDGIVFVVDCGLVKLRTYEPVSGLEALAVVPVSRASAAQRAGRAGRTQPGKCFRLYTRETMGGLADATVPEVQRSNLVGVVLQLKALGIDNVARFDFVSSPPAELVIKALELLYMLGALDDYARLTDPVGLRMAELPLDAQTAKSLLAAPDFGCLDQMLTIAAMVSVESVFYTPHDDRRNADAERLKFAVDEGDHLTLYNVYQAFVGRGNQSAKWAHNHYLNYKALERAASVRRQLVRYMDRMGVRQSSTLATATAVAKCLAAAHFSNAARMQPDGSFLLVADGSTVWVHPSSMMFNRKADWVIFSELVQTGDKVYMMDITKVERDWLVEAAPGYYTVRRT